MSASSRSASHSNRRNSAHSFGMESSIFGSIVDTIGNTPLIPLKRLPQTEGILCKVFVKCEYMNPSGSMHDRIALGLMQRITSLDSVQPGATLVSGLKPETSISAAMISACQGHKNISILPMDMNRIKKDALILLGAKIAVIPEIHRDMQTTEDENRRSVAEELVKQIPGSIDLGLHVSDAQSYGEVIADEILKTGLRPDMFVCSLDFKGSFPGIEKRLRTANSNFFLVGVQSELKIESEPQKSVVNQPDDVQITGISEKEAFVMTRRLIQEQGILCGPSGGAAVVAAFKAINESGMKDDDSAAVVICISESLNYSERQFLTDDWMLKQGFFSEKDMHQRFWWYGVSIGNLRLPSPPTISKTKSIGAAAKILKNQGIRCLIVLDLKTDNPEMTMVGLLTQDLILGLNRGEISEQQCIGDTKGVVCQNFGEISRNATLGELEQKLQLHEFAVVYSVTHKALPDGTSRSYHLPTGIATVIDIIKWTSEVDEHHRQNLASDYCNDMFSEV